MFQVFLTRILEAGISFKLSENGNGGHLLTKMLEFILAFYQYHLLLEAPDNQFSPL